MRARRAALLEGLDDDHAAAAARAGMREGFRLIGGGCIAGVVLRSRRIEQLPGLRDVVRTLGTGEEPVVADAVESAGEHMNEGAADELGGGARQHLASIPAISSVRP